MPSRHFIVPTTRVARNLSRKWSFTPLRIKHCSSPDSLASRIRVTARNQTRESAFSLPLQRPGSISPCPAPYPAKTLANLSERRDFIRKSKQNSRGPNQNRSKKREQLPLPIANRSQIVLFFRFEPAIVREPSEIARKLKHALAKLTETLAKPPEKLSSPRKTVRFSPMRNHSRPLSRDPPRRPQCSVVSSPLPSGGFGRSPMNDRFPSHPRRLKYNNIHTDVRIITSQHNGYP